jgi:hydroxymethylpyrimidine/phosphomethylpyrimidine kinase
MKGGHREGADATDILLTPQAPARRLSAPRLTRGRRGTGCALATAIAAGLARGRPLAEACELGKQHVSELLRAS